ncbi:MAG: hypothetical protein ACOYKJ_06830 [Candidatus Howiella sp.]|jgi:undecaprenyl pyrophosphate phosphatase UppP
MGFFEAIFQGILQGVSKFLPISGSGQPFHLPTHYRKRETGGHRAFASWHTPGRDFLLSRTGRPDLS